MDHNADVRTPGLSLPYVRRPSVAVLVALALYAAVFVMRLTIHGTDPITVFYILPVALLAMAFGLRAGVIAGVVGVLLILVWVVISGVSPEPLGWVGRVAPILLLGVLVGRATDRLRAAAETKQALFAARLREREAAEINDSIIQGLVTAKWAMEAGQIERGLEVLTDTIAETQSLVAALLRSEPLPRSPASAHRPHHVYARDA